jgi:hypothetical protein
MSALEDFETKLLAAAEASRKLDGVTVRAFTVDIQESGEYPYRIAIEEDPLPDVGLLVGEPASGPKGRSIPTERGAGKGGS